MNECQSKEGADGTHLHVVYKAHVRCTGASDQGASRLQRQISLVITDNLYIPALRAEQDASRGKLSALAGRCGL